ncbi:MAG: radical SAM protein, partial [Pseudomonadota bacterium]
VSAEKILIGSEIAKEVGRIDLQPDPLHSGKRILKLVRYKGAFVKPCPGTREYNCCGLKILNVGQGCPIDCRYCALQVYFNNPVMEVYVNLDDMVSELRSFLRKESSDKFFRFCTGEFTDSLALEPFTGYVEPLSREFSGLKNATLEFKTKSDNIEPFLGLKSPKNIIVSFSVNAFSFSKTEEIRAASLERRINAASRLASQGFKVGFHFDPIVPFEGWQESYGKTVDVIFSAVSPGSIVWISLGVLRFVPKLKEVISSRFGPLKYFYDSFSPGLDGKFRLSRERRIDVYKNLARKIKSYGSSILIYLCMESPGIWRDSLDLEIKNNQQLAKLLDAAAMSHIGQ